MHKFVQINLFFLFILFSLFTLPRRVDYPQQEKKIVVVIPSFNNKDWYQKNLDAIFSQDYENYRVIYLDDCSSDGTGDLVAKYIKERGVEDRTIVIRNKKRKRALANLYYAIHQCDDDEIILTYDGDDWLAHTSVFSLINKIYSQNSEVWMTFGQFKNWPKGANIGYSRDIPIEVINKKLYRKSRWMPGQLRTFYAWLFKQIKLEDLIFDQTDLLDFQGYFFPANYDLAICYPMIEMAGKHYRFISQVVYIHNTATPLNDFKANKQIQKEGASQIIKQPVYEQLKSPTIGYLNCFNDSKVDLIVFAFHGINCLKQLFNSIEKYVQGIGNVLIVAKTEEQKRDYQEIVDNYKNKQGGEYTIVNNSSEQLIHFLLKSRQEHVLLIADNMVVMQQVNCNRCIKLLEQTFAYAFFLAVGEIMQDQIPLIEIEQNVFGWRLCYTNEKWRKQHSIMGIYRKQDILKKITLTPLKSLQDILTALVYKKITDKKIGLCFALPAIYQQ